MSSTQQPQSNTSSRIQAPSNLPGNELSHACDDTDSSYIPDEDDSDSKSEDALDQSDYSEDVDSSADDRPFENPSDNEDNDNNEDISEELPSVDDNMLTYFGPSYSGLHIRMYKLHN